MINPENAIAFSGKRNPLIKAFRGRLWPNTAFAPKNKNQMYFSG